MDVPGWPGARAIPVRDAEIVLGRLDALAAALPAPPPGDLIDAGRRHGEPLRLFLRRRAALRFLVGRRLGVAPERIALGYDKRGAPVVRAPAGRLRVSISGRGDLAGFALAGVAVGVDIEPLVDPGPIDAALAPEERIAVATAPDAALARLRRWTAKEAYLKALGTGLSRDPAELAIGPASDATFAVRDGTCPAPGFGRWIAAALGELPVLAAVWLRTR